MSVAQGPVAVRTEGALLWTPSEERRAGTRLAAYERWLAETHGLRFESYEELWRWSVDDVGRFWASVWDYFGVKAHTPYTEALAPGPNGTRVEGARWFTGATLNYAEHVLARSGERGLHRRRARVRRDDGVDVGRPPRPDGGGRGGAAGAGRRRGDGVVAYIPNVPEAIAAALAAASLGASWSSCPPEFGTQSVIERFRQMDPKVLFAVDGYTYNGRRFDSREAVAGIQAALPTLERTVVLPYLEPQPDLAPLGGTASLWADFVVPGGELTFEPVPFDHPLCVAYSSGTTGMPKAIVHGHGGALLEHAKFLSLQMDIGEGDRFFWFSTTGWIMWNILMSGLLLGASIVVYDGSPAHPDMYALWRVAERTRITSFGVSAPYILSCMKAEIEPGASLDLARCAPSGRRARRCRRRASRGCTSTSRATCSSPRSAAARTSSPRSSGADRRCPCAPGRSSAGASAARWRASTRTASRSSARSASSS